jgi:hypothetical protein
MWLYPDLPPHETRFTADNHPSAHLPVVLSAITVNSPKSITEKSPPTTGR